MSYETPDDYILSESERKAFTAILANDFATEDPDVAIPQSVMRWESFKDKLRSHVIRPARTSEDDAFPAILPSYEPRPEAPLHQMRHVVREAVTEENE